MVSDSLKWLIIFSAIIFGWLIYLLAPIITPFLISGVIAYLFDPLVDKLEKKFSRTFSVITIFFLIIILILGLFLILIPILHNEIVKLIQYAPELLVRIQNEYLPLISDFIGYELKSLDIETIRNSLRNNWQEVGNLASAIMFNITSSGQALFTILAYLLLIPVVTFYRLRDWDELLEKMKILIPVKFKKTIISLFNECDNVLSEFLRGQLLVMLSLSLIYSSGLWLAGIEYSLLTGFFSGFVSFVPYLGAITGIVIAGTIAFFQHQDLLHLLFVALVFGTGQAIEGMILSPLLVGDRIGLHPVAVIFAVMAGGQLFGFTGILIALPVAAVLLVVGRFVFDKYTISKLYS